jgi:hypothetical protein
MGRPPITGTGLGHTEAAADQRPENAINNTGVAQGGTGAFGDGARVGVFGSSERNTGIHARSINAIGLVAEGGSLLPNSKAMLK